MPTVHAAYPLSSPFVMGRTVEPNLGQKYSRQKRTDLISCVPVRRRGMHRFVMEVTRGKLASFFRG